MAYVIGSQKGKDIAKNMKTGESYNCSDGSTWTKQSDGSVSVTHNGQTFNNAYTPSSGGGSSVGGGGGSSRGNSQYTGSSSSIITHNSTQQAIKDKMNANSIAWWSADEAGRKRLAAENQNLAAILGGSVSYDSTTGTWGGSAAGNNFSLDMGDILGWENNYVNNNPQPTAPQRDPRIDQLLNQYLNRDGFSHDIEDDPLYQQYKEMYQREGDRAMRNTMAEAAASAGGMNTYAMTAAMQANNYYNSQLNDRIPELYQLAYDMYLNNLDLQIQDLGILQDMDETQYARYRDTMNDWRADKEFAYGVYQDAVNQGNFETNFDYNSMWDNINFNNNNYWANKEYNANRADIDYNRKQEEEEETKAMILSAIGDGVTSFDPALIAKSGMTQEEINLLITARQAQEAPKGTSGGGNRSGSVDSGTGGYTGGGGAGGGDDMSDYTVNNEHGDSWVNVAGLGRLSWDELESMVDNGTVVEIVDDTNKRISYKKA